MEHNAPEGTFSAENFKRRLLKFSQEYLGISQSAFEDSCGISHGTINSIKVKGPSVDILAKISSVYPVLDLNWLVTGNGDMLIAGKTQKEDTVTLSYNELKNVIVEAIKEAKR